MSNSVEVGKIGWIDMTVGDAPGVRDFYKAVVGWETDEIDMGGSISALSRSMHIARCSGRPA